MNSATRIGATVLAALTVLALLSLSIATNSEAMTIRCENSRACPKGYPCKLKSSKNEPGICVAPTARFVALCETSEDCPRGNRCEHKPGKLGICVGTPGPIERR